MVVRGLNANKKIEPPTLLRILHSRLSEINEGILSPSFTIHKIRPVIADMATLKALSRVENVIFRNVTATVKTNISRFSVSKVSVYKQKDVASEILHDVETISASIFFLFLNPTF